MLLHLLLLIASIILSSTKPLIDFTSAKSSRSSSVKELVADWAPLIYLSPHEIFLPLPVPEYLSNVKKVVKNKKEYLVTKEPLNKLFKNRSSFIYGESPSEVPVYVDVTKCDEGSFYVTYWLFYPFNKGKSVCTAPSLIGPVPIPTLAGRCLGSSRIYGDHLADWEHITLFFKADDEYPSQLFMATHTFGAYYKYDPGKHVFRYKSQVKISQVSPTVPYPDTVKIMNDTNHPILFAALGSHGTWPDAGDHKYLKLPKVSDQSGYGTKWMTWKLLEYVNNQDWLKYNGSWGGPSSDCDPAAKFLDALCHYVAGPSGIKDPDRRKDFTCPPVSTAAAIVDFITDVV